MCQHLYQVSHLPFENIYQDMFQTSKISFKYVFSNFEMKLIEMAICVRNLVNKLLSKKSDDLFKLLIQNSTHFKFGKCQFCT